MTQIEDMEKSKKYLEKLGYTKIRVEACKYFGWDKAK